MSSKRVFILSLSVLLLLTSTLFAQVDVARQTKAVTYPLDKEVLLRFRGTTRFPRMKGEAKIKRSGKRGTQIDLSVSKMPRPFELGAGYATYVLWAISPTGQVDNLGEIKRRGFWEFDSSIKVTTPLQTFALIITAEPHFLVSRPSQEIMLENLNPYSRDGSTFATTTTISYFGNSSDYFRDARTPRIADVDYRKTPITILQARQAVALAKYAGADRDARKELDQAEVMLRNAVSAWQAGRDDEYVDIAARKAISQAVQAETTAAIRKTARDKRNEKIRQDAELKSLEDKLDAANQTISELRNELSSENRRRELSERDAENYEKQIRELREENRRLRKEREDARVDLAKLEAKQRLIEEAQNRAKRRDELNAQAQQLKQSLASFGSVSESDRGIVLTIDESLWTSVRVSSFADGKAEQIDNLAALLNSNTDFSVTVESHVDSKGEEPLLQLLTDERAQAIADRMVSAGVSAARITSKGMGPKVPLFSNDTWANRNKNRRVEIILSAAIN